MKRMTSQDPLQRKKWSFKQTVTLNRLISILGTGRVKTACGSQHGRYDILIGSDKNQSRSYRKFFYHLGIFPKISCRYKKGWFPERFAASFLAMIFISRLPGIFFLFKRKYSRQSRLILFRITAFPIFFVTVIPSRDRSDFPGQNSAIKYLFWSFFPDFDR